MRRIPAATWRKMSELIMTWAQDDRTCDDVTDLFAAHLDDEGLLPEEFWSDLRARLEKAFG